jgi:diguanylate cyclase (GGDEF)-like protein
LHGCFLIASSVSILLNSPAIRPILTLVTSCLWFLAISIIAHGANIYERTERRRNQAELAFRKLAIEDTLTGTLNRRGFLAQADSVIRQLELDAADGGVLEIDIDNLKTINDVAGTAIGDELIVRLGAIISRAVRKSDIVARLEADRFGVILRNASLSDSCQVAEKFLSVFRESNAAEIDGFGNATASAGISSLKTGGYDLRNLLLQVDLALRSAKTQGRNRSEIYRPGEAIRQSETLKLAFELQHALARDQISIVYQPQIDLSSGRLVGAEALARWEHPSFGRVPPDRFIPLAESNGHIISIGTWIMNSACGQLRLWIEAGHSNMTVAVNVSVHQLKDPGFVDVVLKTLTANEVSPNGLVLEITESVSMTSGDIGIETMRKLSSIGIRIALDDFGTGYSSLSYLRLLPCDYLKIDRSFIMDLPGNLDAVSIARAIIGMGRSLGLKIIAEGVENQEQAEFLQSLWCEEAQGYFYSRPLSPGEFLAWIQSWADAKMKPAKSLYGGQNG